MRAIITVMLITASALAHAEIYKCVVNGQTVFSQQPCAEDAQKIKPHYAAPPEGAVLEQARINQQVEKMARQYDLRKLREQQIANGQVGLGMTAEEVLKSWGMPSKINRSVYPSGVHEQWVYYRGPGTSQYVYLENGIVVGMN